MFLFVGWGNSLVLLLPLKSNLQKQQPMCCQWDGYKNHDEKLNRRDGRGEASKKTVQALNVSFQVKGGDFYWLGKDLLEYQCFDSLTTPMISGKRAQK